MKTSVCSDSQYLVYLATVITQTDMYSQKYNLNQVCKNQSEHDFAQMALQLKMANGFCARCLGSACGRYF